MMQVSRARLLDHQACLFRHCLLQVCTASFVTEDGNLELCFLLMTVPLNAL